VCRINQRFIGRASSLLWRSHTDGWRDPALTSRDDARKFRTANIADEQRVAGQDSVRFVCALCEIEYENGNRFDGVAWRFEHLYPKAGNSSASPSRIGTKAYSPSPAHRAGYRRHKDRATPDAPRRNRRGSGQKNVAYPHAQMLGVGDILLDVALRIDHDASAAGLIGDQ